MVGNLWIVLLVDHIVNRKWWQLMNKNSLGRHHMYNSTSILADMDIPLEPTTFGSNLIIKVRTLCTYHWFFTSHLLFFGLSEDPTIIRRLATGKMAKNRGTTTSTSSKPMNTTKSIADQILQAVPETPTGDETNIQSLLVLQDNDGRVHLFDSDKKQVQALGVEVKILRDSDFCIG